MSKTPQALLLLLATAIVAPAASAPAGAQERIRPTPCPTRHCVMAPCPPPPCARPVVAGRVERSAREVKIVLEGRVLRYEVTERWTNHGPAIGEADYVLPLPRGAAFEDLALEIDGELVTGETRGAGEARRIYEEIVRQRRDPALVEWMDLGVLRTRVFPIQPGETRTVVVRFRAVADREGDALRVDVPAPRGDGAEGRGTTLRLQVPAEDGFGDIWSPTHGVTEGTMAGRRTATVTDAVGTVTLLVPVRAGHAAAVSVLTHAPARDDGYALITLSPPNLRRATAARDVTFVLDVSGSMSGEKLEQARAAGKQFLAALTRGDRFRLIAFSGDVQEYREEWTAATAQDRRDAEAWLDGLRAGGGTNIAGALERALEAPIGARRLGLVLFLTDGAPTVGERRPERLAARAGELRGARRVFTFGLGADVNASLLERLALDGAGTAHFVRPEEDVERVVGVAAERLTHPVATDVRIRAEGVTLHAVQPAGTIDLFAGQELTVLARYRGNATRARLVITGRTPEGPVTWTATASFPARRGADAFVGRLWATQRVGWLSAERRREGANPELDAEIRGLGERWGIPTELTSYLVLEPGMQPTPAVGRRDMPASVSTAGQGAGGRVTRDQVAPSVARAAAPSSQGEFERAKAAAEMRATRSEATADASLADAGVMRAGQRLFTLRDSVWVDSRPAGPAARRLEIQPYSAAYFALIDRIPELRQVFALGDRVEVHGRAVTVVLAPNGKGSIEAAALDAIVRDW